MVDRRAFKLRAPRLLLVVCVIATVLAISPAEGVEKVFVYALEGEPESLDTAKSTSERAIHVAWLICEALINISKDGKFLESGLATSWTLSHDGLHAVMRLQPGVLFHDGTAFDSNAVKTSFERQFRPDHPLYSDDPKNTKKQFLSELIENIQAPGPLTVIFKLKYPGLHYLSQVDIVSPAAVTRLGKGFGRQPVCTGPFKFENWLQDRIALTANDRYWAGRPQIDRVVLRFVPEAKAIAEALIRGEVDFAPGIRDPVLLERLRESPPVQLQILPGLNISYLGFYSERPPFNNPVLRRAVVHAVNVPRTVLFLGRGAAVGAKGPLPPAMKAYDPAVTQAPHNLDVARELLSMAGYSSGLTVGLVHNSAVSFVAELAGAIQSDLRRIGITVNLLAKPSWRDVVMAARAREGDMFQYDWNVRAPYPERLLFPLFHSRSIGSSNLTHYSNPAVDKMLEEAFRLPEGPTQEQIYSKIQKMIVEDAPMVFLYHSARVAAYTGRVKGLEINLGADPYDKLVKVDLNP